jgi:hypothetical protein
MKTDKVTLIQVMWSAPALALDVALRVMLARSSAVWARDFSQPPNMVAFALWLIDSGFGPHVVAEVARFEALFGNPPEPPSRPARGQMWRVVDRGDPVYPGDVLIVRDVLDALPKHRDVIVFFQTPNAFDQSSETWDVVADGVATPWRDYAYTYAGDAPPELLDEYAPPPIGEALRVLGAPRSEPRNADGTSPR